MVEVMDRQVINMAVEDQALLLLTINRGMEQIISMLMVALVPTVSFGLNTLICLLVVRRM